MLEEFIKIWFFTGLFTLFTIFLIIKLFPKIWLLDKPKKFWFSRKAIPYPAWIIIPLLFFWLSFFFIEISKPFLGFFIASFILVFVSFVDDLRNLNPFFRLFIQALCAGIIIFSGIWINEILNPFWWKIDLTFWKIDIFWHNFFPLADFLVFFWILLLTNSMNFFDWVSGNTSWISAICGWFLFILSILPPINQFDIWKIFLIFAIISTIFFIFDLEKPKILMWDSGSMFLGFSLAVFSVFAGGKMAIALILLAFPIFDLFFTIFRRWKNWKSIFKWDLEHFHHILVEKFWSRKKAVLIYLAICLLFWIPLFFLETTWKYILIFTIFIFIYLLQKNFRK